MIFDGISNFFDRESNLKSTRLSGNSPCIDCENIHRYNRGTALMAEEVEPEKCEMCTKKLNYDADCRMKLAYYERNDPRVKDQEQKSAHIYDRGGDLSGNLMRRMHGYISERMGGCKRKELGKRTALGHQSWGKQPAAWHPRWIDIKGQKKERTWIRWQLNRFCLTRRWSGQSRAKEKASRED